MKKKVSDLIAEFLKQKGIRHVFGIIGSGNAHIFDSIYALGYTEIICMHHEQAAVMAAGTYYRTSGKMSAALLTTGAGSLNGVTGVVSLWMDSIPGLIISGNENSKYTSSSNPLRIWGIQGYDSPKMVQDYTKHAHRVMDEKDIICELEKSYDFSLQGRPGPVWLDVPMNIQAAQVEEMDLVRYVPKTPFLFSSNPKVPSLEEGILAILNQLEKAQRPLLWLGHGIRLSGAVEMIEPLLTQLNVPAIVSWAGIDMVASDHPAILGRAGIYGQRAANFVLQNCDFLLTIGTRLAIPQVGYDISELARAAQIVVVDIDPEELKKYENRTAFSVCADAKYFMEELTQATHRKQWNGAGRFSLWWERCHQYRREFPWVGPEHRDKEGYLNSYPFMEKISELLKPEAVVVTDMGTALLSGHQALKLKKGQRLMTSTGLGEMGFGLPGAIGASVAKEKGESICLNCDGGMMMNLQELQTVAHHQLPLKIVIFNNDGYLMIKHTQKALFQGRFSGTDVKSGVSCPNYEALAKAFGFDYHAVRTWEDFDREVPLFLNHEGPSFCEVFMHPEQLLVPKLALAPQNDGSIISPPLEDLSPFLMRAELARNMLMPLHPKSAQMQDPPNKEQA